MLQRVFGFSETISLSDLTRVIEHTGYDIDAHNAEKNARMLESIKPVCSGGFRDWRNAQGSSYLHRVPTTHSYLHRYDFRSLDMASQLSRLVYDRQRFPETALHKLHIR